MITTPDKTTKILVLLALVASLVMGCSQGRSLRLRVRDNFVNDRLSVAQTEAFSEALLKDEDNKLLSLMDIGLIYHQAGQYEGAILFLTKAKEESKRLFTESISKNLESLATNDKALPYSGNDYEISMIYFYLALNHLLLAQTGQSKAWSIPRVEIGDQLIFEAEDHPARQLDAKTRRRELLAARAEILEWDSVLSDMANQSAGLAVFKNDLMAKLFGATVHEIIGSPSDRRIALQLYKDAREVLFRNYNIYRSFNQQNDRFIAAFDQLPNMAETEVKQRYVAETDYARELQQFIDTNIERLEQILNNPKDENRQACITFIAQNSTVEEKKAKKYEFGLIKAIESVKNPGAKMIIARVGIATLFAFAPKVGLHPAAGVAGGMLFSIAFEMPQIPLKPASGRMQLVLRQQNGTATTFPLVLVDPLNDIAYRSVEARSTHDAAKIGLRAGIKYATALALAYGVYEATKAKSNPFIASSAAFLFFVGEQQAINATEKADTRAWNILPADLRLAKIQINPGTYSAELQVENPAGNQRFSLGEWSLRAGDNRVFTYRTTQ